MCVCKYVYPHLTDLLSESGAALRINNGAHKYTHAHTHTFTLTVSSVGRQSPPAPWVFLSSRADGEHSE